MEKSQCPLKFFRDIQIPTQKYEESIMDRKHQWTGTICKIMNRISEGI